MSKPYDLWFAWGICFGSLVAAFPFYSYLVFGLGYDRGDTANILSIQVTIAYWAGILAGFLPLPSQRHKTTFQRVQTVCLTFLLVSYCTHLSWELLWLILHEPIAAARDQMWAYPWWAYIDGGDTRYYQPEPHFLMLEVLSVTNGTIGMIGLVMLWRSRFTSLIGILMCMSTAVTHTVTTWYYYGSEALSGFASVNTESFIDLWVKFVLLNGPWLVFPWLVLYWGYNLIKAPKNAGQRKST